MIDGPPSDAPERAPRGPGLRDAVAALRYRDFAFFWTGALLSNSGTWVQTVAVAYVIYQLTGSAVIVSIASFVQLVPLVVMGPWGGATADRHDRRTILLIGQGLQAVLALVLWLTWVAGYGTVPVILGLTLLSGFVNGGTIPAWQAFVSELVPREALLNAVTLNSTQFNGARAFGPALGGFVLWLGGPGAAFMANAISFAAVLGALAFIHPAPRAKAIRKVGDTAWRSFREAIAYSRRRPGIMTCFIVVAALGGLGSPFVQLMPVFAGAVFHVDAVLYGWLQAALGIGSVLTAPLLAGRGTVLRRSRLVEGSMVVYGLAMVGFVASSWYAVGFVSLMMAGAGYLGLASTLNTTLQLQVAETMRGKVLSLYVIALTASLPIGLLVQAGMVAVIGPRWTTAVFATAFLGVFAWARFGGAFLVHLDDEGDGPVPIPEPPPTIAPPLEPA